MSASQRLQALLDSARRRERTLVMGVLNVTPDSFYDGGRHTSEGAALRQAERLAEEGADIIDVGGESSRPGAEPVTVGEEIARTVGVVRRIARSALAPVSIDTAKAEVARRAIDAGAAMVNDITALTADPAMARVVAESGSAVCLMHMQGEPRTMQRNPTYGDVVADVCAYLAQRARAAEDAGVGRERIVLDPGFGFGKRAAHNLEIVRRLREVADLGYPVLLGPSRKSTIGEVLGGLPPEERLEGSAALVALAVAHGVAIVRVHDVRAMVRVARVADAVVRGWPSPPRPSAAAVH
ncbi:MAG TPA: dihydropteroate synthase [Chthonomonadales bacterium]|nr:dihydropteroate synthase [Chthonomonadales bacterium]